LLEVPYRDRIAPSWGCQGGLFREDLDALIAVLDLEELVFFALGHEAHDGLGTDRSRPGCMLGEAGKPFDEADGYGHVARRQAAFTHRDTDAPRPRRLAVTSTFQGVEQPGRLVDGHFALLQHAQDADPLSGESAHQASAPSRAPATRIAPSSVRRIKVARTLFSSKPAVCPVRPSVPLVVVLIPGRDTDTLPSPAVRRKR